MSTAIKVEGGIKVTAIDAFGGERVVYDGHNLIMDAGLSALPILLAQTVGVPADYAIATLRAGDSATAPSNTDTNVTNQIGPDKAFTLVTLDSGGTPGLVDFETSLATTEGNGFTIREVGLFLAASSTMFSRQVIGAVAKTNAITLKFNWRIQFSRV